MPKINRTPLPPALPRDTGTGSPRPSSSEATNALPTPVDSLSAPTQGRSPLLGESTPVGAGPSNALHHPPTMLATAGTRLLNSGSPAGTRAPGAASDHKNEIKSVLNDLTQLTLSIAMTPFAGTPVQGAGVRHLLSDLVEASGAPQDQCGAAIRATLIRHGDTVSGGLSASRLSHLTELAGLGDVARAMGGANPPPALEAWSLLAPEPVRNAAGWTLTHALTVAPDALFLPLAQHLNEALETFDISKLPLFEKMFNPTDGLDLSDFPEELGRCLPNLMRRYLGNLDLASKRRFTRAVLDLPPTASEGAQLAAVMQECGPGLQKLMQLAASRSKSPMVKEALETLYANVKPLTLDQVKTRIQEETGEPWSATFAEITEQPLGSATVGQVHAARLHDGREVVVKVTRPGLRDTLRKEFDDVRNAASENTFIHNFLYDLEEAGLRELDLRKEARFLEEGIKVYHHPNLGIQPVALINDVSPTPGLMVMGKAGGISFNATPSPEELLAAGLTEAEYVGLKVKVLETFMEVWYRSLAFKDNAFMHADLHPGNLLFELRPGEHPAYRLHIIDFGSSEQLRRGEQNALYKMGGAIAMHHYTGMGITRATDTFLEGFEALAGKMNPEQRAQMEAFTRKTLEARCGEPIEQMETIVKKTATFKIPVPFCALQIGRGHKFLEGIGKELNRRLDQVDPNHRESRFDISRVYVGGTARHYLPWGDSVYPVLQSIGSGLGVAYRYRDVAYGALLLYGAYRWATRSPEALPDAPARFLHASLP